jgi:hypothetical protein
MMRKKVYSINELLVEFESLLSSFSLLINSDALSPSSFSIIDQSNLVNLSFEFHTDFFQDNIFTYSLSGIYQVQINGLTKKKDVIVLEPKTPIDLYDMIRTVEKFDVILDDTEFFDNYIIIHSFNKDYVTSVLYKILSHMKHPIPIQGVILPEYSKPYDSVYLIPTLRRNSIYIEKIVFTDVDSEIRRMIEYNEADLFTSFMHLGKSKGENRFWSRTQIECILNDKDELLQHLDELKNYFKTILQNKNDDIRMKILWNKIGAGILTIDAVLTSNIDWRTWVSAPIILTCRTNSWHFKNWT